MIQSITDSKSFICTTSDINARATKSHQTHNSKILSAVYSISTLLTKPVANGVHDILVLTREGERGPGGESKRYKVVTAIAWLSLALLTLPLVILGIIGKQVFHPGQGKDKLVFMNAAAQGYNPPTINDDDEIALATCNVAWLPSPVDALKDVYAAEKRAEELAEWIKKQPNQPLCVGLQEAFDPDASRAFTNGLKDLYPYAVTNAGWADVPLLGSNSGLQFHSKVPIKSAGFYPFQDLDGFGVKCSDRGVLKVELDLGNGKSAMVYVTHMQPHANHKDIRKNELQAITRLMRKDQQEDPRDGHYYLIGDLNVSNVDDEKLEVINEHQEFLKEGEPLNPRIFHDPFPEGNHEGTFYKGADRKDRGENGYGTTTFLQGKQDAVDDCRYDYILRLKKSVSDDFFGKAEIKSIHSEKFPTCPLSDHKMVTATFKKMRNIE